MHANLACNLSSRLLWAETAEEPEEAAAVVSPGSSSGMGANDPTGGLERPGWTWGNDRNGGLGAGVSTGGSVFTGSGLLQSRGMGTDPNGGLEAGVSTGGSVLIRSAFLPIMESRLLCPGVPAEGIVLTKSGLLRTAEGIKGGVGLLCPINGVKPGVPSASLLLSKLELLPAAAVIRQGFSAGRVKPRLAAPTLALTTSWPIVATDFLELLVAEEAEEARSNLKANSSSRLCSSLRSWSFAVSATRPRKQKIKQLIRYRSTVQGCMHGWWIGRMYIYIMHVMQNSFASPHPAFWQLCQG